jgi:hypothetical protein
MRSKSVNYSTRSFSDLYISVSYVDKIFVGVYYTHCIYS